MRDYLFVATALSDSADGRLKIETRNPFAVGDMLEALSPGRIPRAFAVESIEDADGQRMQRSAVPMRILAINAPDGILKDDILRRHV